MADNAAPSRSSINSRQRRLLGTLHFQTPITPQTPGTDIKRNTSKNRNQSLQAQRDNRKRTQDYIKALENEVMSLRSEKLHIQKESETWKKSTMALSQYVHHLATQSHSNAQLGPGIFLWVSQDAPREMYLLPWQHWQSQQLMNFQYPNISSHLDTHSASVHELLQHFCDHIAPKLSLTEASTNGYINHIIPLAMESDAVLNSFLAVSASHLQSIQGKYMTADILKYKSVAIKGLQSGSSDGFSNYKSCLSTLATILGLLLQDAISDARDYRPLLKLIDSWARISCHQYPTNDAIQFFLDQIQMLVEHVYPLYQFAESYRSSRSPQLVHGPLDQSNQRQPDFRTIFMALENAVAQACQVQAFSPTDISEGRANNQLELDLLLDHLQLTVNLIPPFSPGENSLTWVHTIAASRSTKADHISFFNMRLAELRGRIGYLNTERQML